MTTPRPVELNLLRRIERGEWLGSPLFQGLIAEGPLDVDALAEATRRLPEHHDALRTGFRQGSDGTWDRFVVEEAETPLEVDDLRGTPDAETAARQLVVSFRHRPLLLYRPRLARAIVLRLADETTWYCRQASHLILDGWSVVLLNTETAERYRALTGASGSTDGARAFSSARVRQDPPEPRLDPASAAHWQAHAFDGLVLRPDAPEQVPPDTVAGHLTLMTPPDLADALEAASASPRAACIVAWADATAPLAVSGAGDLHIAYANRRSPSRQGVVGYLAVSVPLRVPIEPGWSIHGRIGATMRRLAAHQVHIDALPEKPRSDSIVDFHSVSSYSQELELPGVTLRPHLTLPDEVHRMFVHYPLELHVARLAPGGLLHLVRYRRDLFDAQTVADIARRYHGVLEDLANHRPGGLRP